MSKFDLGLEALADQQDLELTGDILSYEYLDTVMQFHEEAAEAIVIADGIASMMSAMENLGAICEVLETHGNSPALEALVGSNFREGFSLEAAGNAKEGLWARFVKWLKSLWAKIKAFFAKYFSSSKSMVTAIRERVRALKDGQMKEIDVTLPKATVMAQLTKIIKDDLMAGLNECAAHVKKLNNSDAFAGNKFEFSKVADAKSFLEKEFGKEGAKVKVTKTDAIDMLEQIATNLDALNACQRLIDQIADDLNRTSYNTDKQTVKDNIAAAKEEATKAGKSDKEVRAAGREAKAFGEAQGSDEYRKNVMKLHSEVSSFLAKCTRDTLAQGSYALSAFKVSNAAK